MAALLTLPDVAADLQKSVRAVRSLIARRQLDAIKVGRDWRIDPSALARFKTRQTRRATDERPSSEPTSPVARRRRTLPDGYASMSPRRQREVLKARGLLTVS